MSLDITLKQALLGFTKYVKHLDGHTVTIDRADQVTKPGLVLRVKGEGMPVFGHYGDHGDLLITIVVEFPKTLNPM